MRRAGKAAVILGLGLLLAGPRPSSGKGAGRSPRVTTPHFAFYSDFDTNLNDALIAAGLARKGGKPELFHSGDEAACFDKLPPSARAGWDRAVDYYKEIISSSGWDDRPQHWIRVDLAGFDEELKDDDARQFVEIARSFRAAGTPAYRTCRWTIQDEKNRRWIDAVKSRLAVDEERIASSVVQLYQKQWKEVPIPVDVVETVNWAGANSILRGRSGGHLLISTAYEGPSAVEVVFHEASHLLMTPRDPLAQALDGAARAADSKLPGDLAHVVLFYTTGEAVRRILAEDGESGYTPMRYGIFGRGSWSEYRQPLETEWRPYLDGGRSLHDAAAGLIEVMPKPGASPEGEKPKATAGSPQTR